MGEEQWEEVVAEAEVEGEEEEEDHGEDGEIVSSPNINSRMEVGAEEVQPGEEVDTHTANSNRDSNKVGEEVISWKGRS